MLRNFLTPTPPPPPLAAILAEFAEVGIRATPLAVLCAATDRGLSDAQIGEIVDTLAGAGELEDAA